LQAGDLYFDTTSGYMRYYDGSAWNNIVAATGDMSTQNANSVAITGGTVQGVTITNSTINNDMDFGSI